MRLADPSPLLVRVLFMALCSGVLACSQAPEVVTVPELRRSEVRVPVVFVPGTLGSKLRDKATGKVLWGKGKNVILPRDGGYAAALPLAFSREDAARAEAFRVVDKVGLLGVRRVVYQALAELFENHGYRQGDLDSPRPGDTLFFHAYDWRRDHVVLARELLGKLERLRRARHEQVLAVDLICQSNGAHLCRYLVKYGGASLSQAEAGEARGPENIAVERLILVGTANGGSLRTLRELNRGRRYLGTLGRAWWPETLFTFRSLYQDLPAWPGPLFLDEEGHPLDVDLYDVRSWQRFGWSIYGGEARRRLDRKRRPELFGSEEEREAYLRQMLVRARRFQRLLARDVAGFGKTRYYLLQNVYEPSPRRAVLIENGGAWQTLFTGDAELEKRPHLHALASAPGDGHATMESQQWLSPQEKAALAAEPYYVAGSHHGIVLEPAAQEQMLKLLQEGTETRLAQDPAISGEASQEAPSPDPFRNR